MTWHNVSDDGRRRRRPSACLRPIGRVGRLDDARALKSRPLLRYRREHCADTLADGRLAAGSDDQR